MKDARKLLLVGNGGIALELVYVARFVTDLCVVSSSQVLPEHCKYWACAALY